MQRILVLGGSGSTGRLVVEQALAIGHTVTALSRHPEKTGVTHARLTLVMADMTAGDEWSRVLPGHDVVISVLGVGLGLRSGNLLAKATPTIIAAMERHGVRRFVFVSALGVGGTAPEAPLISRLMFRFLLRDVYADKAAAETMIRASALDWTILAPTRLTDGPATGHVRLLETLREGPWTIRRADVASGILRAVEDDGTIRRRLVVAG